jgi:hypothetical protein
VHHGKGSRLLREVIENDVERGREPLAEIGHLFGVQLRAS